MTPRTDDNKPVTNADCRRRYGIQKLLFGTLIALISVGLTAFIWVSSIAASKAGEALEKTTELHGYQEEVKTSLRLIREEQRDARKDRKKLIEDVSKMKGKLGLNGG